MSNYSFVVVWWYYDENKNELNSYGNSTMRRTVVINNCREDILPKWPDVNLDRTFLKQPVI